MVTDEQVRLLMSLIQKGVSQVMAAAKAGMSERTARKYLKAGEAPSRLKVPHRWRTRPDPFAGVWNEVEELLAQDAGLEAKTVFEELCARYPGRFLGGELRTLQRRLRVWRARCAAPPEVFFPQVHVPGEQGQSDFTDTGELGIRIGGEPFAHLLYHFVLTYSNWESVSVCFSESFEALSAGLQRALWQLGGVPREHRTDNLSAATHELRESRGRSFTARYRELLEHYGLRGSRNFPGNAHENGDVESSHGGLKNALDQRLRLRGSREFATREDYETFLQGCIGARNAARAARFAEERPALRALPARALPDYRELFATVSRSSVVRVVGRTYSVPARLIGQRLRVRVHAAMVEFEHQGELIGCCERLVGERLYHIDYRHIVHALVRKPGAFRRYAYREALFPTLDFRRAYDVLSAQGPTAGADLEYVRLLQLAAQEGEAAVASALGELLAEGVLPGYVAVRARVRSPHGIVCAPALEPVRPDLQVYDRLLAERVAVLRGVSP
jgi:transposase